MPAITYNRDDVPTIKAFMESDAFIRGLMGPFGCLSADTEFLTPLGWKRLDEYAPGDQVAEWNVNGAVKFVEPLNVINELADNLLLFDSGSLKMAVSPEHRVPHWNWAADFQVKTAAEIAVHPSRRTIPTLFSVSLDGVQMSDDLIRFAVMMHADGHYPPHGRRAIICVRKERKKDRIRQLLTALQIKWVERQYPARPTEITFCFEPPYKGKRFDCSWYALNDRQLRIVLDEIEHWDGLFNHAETVFTTAHKEDADFIQYAAHATGRRASIHSQVHKSSRWKPTYYVRIRTSDNAKNRAAIREHTNISVIKAPKGRKYCFTTSTGFFIARYRDTIFVTGNSGKSSGCVWDLIQRGLRQKPGPDGVRRSRWAAIRNTFSQLEDTTVRTVHQWFPPGQFGKWKPSDHTYVINTLQAAPGEKPAEIEFLFRALDRPDHVNKLLSLELTGAWVNEAREVPWPIIEALQGRVDRYPAKRDGGATWAGVILDTNPPDVESAWYQFFEEQDHSEAIAELAKTIPGMTLDKYSAIFKQPSGLSPEAENASNQSPGYWHRLAIGKSAEWVKVYVKGEYGFVIDGQPVFPEYEEAFHCAEVKSIPDAPIYRSYDFGLTPACVFSQILPSGQWIVVDEIVATSMGIDRFSDQVLAHSARHFSGAQFIDIGDPAGQQRAQTDERTCFEILHAKGIMIEPGLQTLAIRLESVRSVLMLHERGRPMFVIHPRCKMLRRALMGGYQYRRLHVSQDRYGAMPDKNAWSHVADALCYAGSRLFGPGLLGNQNRESEDADIAMLHSRLAQDQTRSRVTGY